MTEIQNVAIGDTVRHQIVISPNPGADAGRGREEDIILPDETRALAAGISEQHAFGRLIAISLPVGNWIVFYSFVIDHDIPFAYERPLCAKSGRSESIVDSAGPKRNRR
ncbi:hypothetical protein [Bradyrhizobium lablabi]|uniref:hypothetical protein n=1 Tax=Bradyrhizobium lablabi TaxID=722472 RepID=UPI0009A7FA04|nr:hypothetical protein [Bradyrhizobium lablabi]